MATFNIPSQNIEDMKTYPEEANLATIRHPRINEHPHFIELKKYLQRFYKDRRRPTERQLMHPGKTMLWKEHFYTSLQTLMSEVTYTECESMQYKLLDKVHRWFLDKVRDRINLPQLSEKPKVKTKPRPCTQSLPPLPPATARKATVPLIPPLIPKSVPESKENNPYAIGNRLMEIPKQEAVSFSIKDKNAQPSKKSRSVVFDRAESPPETKTQNKQFVTSDLPPIEFVDFREDSNKNADKYPGFEIRDQFKRKVFHEIYSEVSHEKKEQICEVIDAKNKLAAKHIPCTVRTLETGLILPDIPFGEMLTPACFPKGGEKLMKKLKKKTKKKKKKKRKGKKGKKKGKK